jgi:hypothetical protein
MQRLELLSTALSQDDYRTAISSIQKNKKLYSATNRYLFYMDIGLLFHYAGIYDSSIAYLLKASDIYDALYTRSVSNEAASLLINDNIRPYRSHPFEVILLHQTAQLGYLAQGNIEDALVEARRTQLLLDTWSKKEAARKTSMGEGLFHCITSAAYSANNDEDDAAIAAYKAIKAYRQGPINLPPLVSECAYATLARNNRQSDIEELGLSALSERSSMRKDSGQSELIVIGYAGRGPVLRERVWWGTYVVDGMLILHHTEADGTMETMTMPAPPLTDDEKNNGQKTKSGTTLHIKVSVPEVQSYPAETKSFVIRSPSLTRPVQTEVADDIDVLANDALEQARTVTFARTVTRVVLRTIAAQKAKAEMQTASPLANLIFSLTTDIAADQLEHADTRICLALPKTIQIARISLRPGAHSFEIAAQGDQGILGAKTFADVNLLPGQKKFLLISSLR